MSIAWRKRTLSLSVAAVLAGMAPLAVAQGTAKPDAAPAPAAKAPKQAAELSLKVGDNPPELKVEKWVKGDPVTGFEKGKTYVVEFWATWCGPCIKNIPHLTELQAKNKNVKFIGVSIWEPSHPVEDGTYLDRVKDFVKNQGDKMGYTVAFGGEEAPMAKTWMEAAGQNGIPTAFIVNSDTKVAWIGHPAELEKVLGEVVAGTYDMKAAADKSARAAGVAKKARALSVKLKDAMDSDNKAEQIKIMDEFIELDPVQFQRFIGGKFKTLLIDMKDDKAAYAYATKVSEGVAKDNFMTLNEIAWTIVDTEGVPKRDYDVALKIATRADDLTKHEDPSIMDTLARVYFEKGNIDKAVEIETKAVSLLTDQNSSPSIRDDLEAALKKYKAAKK